MPVCDTIIEPFAGTARYALRYAEKNVWINDKYNVVYHIWKWIQQASRADVEALPELNVGECISDCKQLSQPERDLLGLSVGGGRATPGNKVTTWKVTNVEGGRIGQVKRSILKYIDRIRHWTITNLDYIDLPNRNATWFIDPPYSTGGKLYVENRIDYGFLARWCKDRQGQVIVCENEGATWLPFRPLANMQGVRYQRLEMLWTQGE